MKKKFAAMALCASLMAVCPGSLASGIDLRDPNFSIAQTEEATYLQGPKVEDGLTTDEILRAVRVPNGTRAEIRGDDGTPAMASETVRTGQSLHLYDGASGKQTDRVVIVVSGDVLGTGANDISQLTAMARCLAGTTTFSRAQEKAADRNNNGRVEISDLVAQARALAVPSIPAPTPVPTAAPESVSPQEAMSRRALVLVNEIRASQGRNPLKANAKLDLAAMTRAREMAAEGKISHTRPDGSMCDTAFESGSWKGENCVKIWGDSGADPTKRAVELWKNSPAHYDNLIFENYVCMGTAFVEGEDGAWYGCQVFSGSEDIESVDSERFPRTAAE